MLGYTMMYLSALTSGAGILVIPVIGVHCLLAGKYRRLAVIVGHAVVILALTLALFPPHSRNTTSLMPALFSPLVVTEFLVNFCGNLVPARLPCQVLGLSALALIAFAVWNRFHVLYPQYFYLASLQILTGLAAALARFHLGAEYGLESKYSVYTIVLWASLITMLWRHLCTPASQASHTLQQYVLAGTYALCFTTCGCSWAYNRISVDNLARVHWIVHPNVTHARGILNTASEKGIYDSTRYISNAVR